MVVSRKYGVSAWCKNCMYYVGRRAGKHGYYCRKHHRHVSPFDSCGGFEIYEKRVWKKHREKGILGILG